MKTLKYSRQRESIKACLMGRHDHPTADAIYTTIREEFPNISLGTVYRNLNLLVELGEIQKLTCGDGKDHFDADILPHYHFICRQCGTVSDLPLEPLSDVTQKAQAGFNGRVDTHVTYFYGICAECMALKQH
ncbi:MAG: transcriptional repressor [Clostridium sp.]|nr:transcriptional repressor [Clostridium sp.]MCI6886299.1 transcriptional repressor [Lachnospiraceae bacterium]